MYNANRRIVDLPCGGSFCIVTAMINFLLGLLLVVISLPTLGDEYHNTIAIIFKKRIAINPDVIAENFIRITILLNEKLG